MRIKKYVTKSMKEALLQIRQELGEDAVILKTARAPGKLFSQGEIEVTAAIDEDAAGGKQNFAPLRVPETGVYKRPRSPGPAQPKLPSGNAEAAPRPQVPSAIEALAALAGKSASERRKTLGPAPAASDSGVTAETGRKFEEIKADIRELKSLFSSIAKGGVTAAAGGGFTGEWGILYSRLVDAEVPPGTARELVARMQAQPAEQGADVVKQFVAELNACFQSSSPPALKSAKPVVVMFVGPTGMGKTTTLAKLAAYHVLSKKKSVSVITADTYRIAAIDQIRTFTDIMGLPLHIVFSTEEAGAALAACANSDLVFVDTAGRSQRSSEHMEELTTLVTAIRPDEIHLVLSAGTKVSDLGSAIDRYRALGVNRLLFTKLDETGKLGNVLAAAVQSNIPFSYFTFGQRVPDDIELAQPQRLAQRLFEGGAA